MWTATTIAHVATMTAVAIIVKSGVAVDFADFAIAIPLFPTRVNGIHRKCVLAVTSLAMAKLAREYDCSEATIWRALQG